MKTFLVNRWVPLSGELDQLKFRRAMNAMSVSPVNRQWLLTEGGLTRREVGALLRQLDSEYALTTWPDSTLAGEGRTESRASADAPSLFGRVKCWLRRPSCAPAIKTGTAQRSAGDGHR